MLASFGASAIVNAVSIPGVPGSARVACEDEDRRIWHWHLACVRAFELANHSSNNLAPEVSGLGLAQRSEHFVAG